MKKHGQNLEEGELPLTALEQKKRKKANQAYKRFKGERDVTRIPVYSTNQSILQQQPQSAQGFGDFNYQQ